MTLIAEHTALVPASPETLYARWADVDTHPEWSTGLAWSRLSEPLGPGASGRLKPVGSPLSWPFTVTELDPGHVFADTTRLPGARLTFRHQAIDTGAGSAVTVTVTLTGPLRGLWLKILGGTDALAADIAQDLTRLVALVSTSTEADSPQA